MLRPLGVYSPQQDTWLLRAELVRAVHTAAQDAPHIRVLDLCTGTGALAVAAPRAGAASVTAVDVGRRAVLSARLNARLHRVTLTVCRGDLTTPLAGERFDIVVANPPYVPAAGEHLPTRAYQGHRPLLGRRGGRTRSAGPGVRGGTESPGPGRSVADCALALCGVDATVKTLAGAGLTASVITRRQVPFGPVLQSRAALLLTPFSNAGSWAGTRCVGQ